MTPHTDGLTDFELAQGSAAGEVWAFEELYRRHQRRVYSLCLRMVGNVADAEDVTQEVFLQLYRKIGSFKGTAALSTRGEFHQNRYRQFRSPHRYQL